VELLELVELLADRDVLDRLAGDGADGERGAAAGVAVELRQDDAVERDLLLERLRDIDGLLAGHRVEDEEHVHRLRRVADADELLHQLLVDVQPAGGVDDDDVLAGLARGVEAALRRLDGILRVRAVDGDLQLAAERLELVDRGRALQVGGDERRLLSRLAQHQRELR
jgi:hypothetical protein